MHLKKVAVSVAVTITAALTATIPATPAVAAPANAQMPFPCGETWYASTYSGHSPSEYSIDWNLIGSDDGFSVRAGVSGTATVTPNSGGYGNLVEVNAGGGWTYRYGHLSVFSVANGQQVNAQTEIGKVGNTGASTGPHLHYEQRLNGAVQPATFNNTAISYNYSLPGNAYTSNNCQGATTAPVRNGAFGGDGSSWTPWPGSNYTTYSNTQTPSWPAYDGDRYASTNTTVAGGGFYQDIPLNTVDGDTVCAEAMMRSGTGSTGASGTLAVWLTGGGQDGADRPSGTLGPQWQALRSCVRATGSRSALRVQIYVTPNAPTLDVDSISAVKSLIRNGAFGGDSSSWTPWSGSNYTTYSNAQTPSWPAYDGDRYASTNTTVAGGGFYQDIPFNTVDGDTVCVEAMMRSSAGSTGAGGTLAVWLTGGGQDGADRPSGALGPQWQALRSCVRATGSRSSVRVQIYATANAPTLDVDSISAVKSLVRNGAFGGDGSSWTPWPGSNYTTYSNTQTPSWPAYDADRYAATNTTIAGGGFYQDISLQTVDGDTVCVEAMMRSSAGSTGAGGTLAVWLTGGGQDGADRPSGALGPQWQALRSCVRATGSRSALRVQIYVTPNAPTLDIDSISVG